MALTPKFRGFCAPKETQMESEKPEGAKVPCNDLLGDATGWAWADRQHAEQWCGGFLSRDDVLSDLSFMRPTKGGWICQTTDVTGDEDEGVVQEGWTFLCLQHTAEFVQPNAQVHRKTDRSEAKVGFSGATPC